ncbi:small subunit of acetolactate synthase-domain-containing protein [Glomus cerebriforme]|uniref:Small subunit of acetolactate synthase-domain-containing protein n=1 Tax=Glomus cerebriforme TaxID=658196 RepID=A0A397T9F5_9GLOM|nr:small subunit of acetolactate synthase-domain-containing protein [Glomus cerebriforme]
MYSGLTRRIIPWGKKIVLPSRTITTKNHSKANARIINVFRSLNSSQSTIPVFPILNRYRSTLSSTSAIEYKLTHPRRKPPPLPKIDTPTPSAEEAVTNILYNTPAPSPSPPKRHILNCLVQNEPGVLSKVSGILAARGFNIDTLVVASTEAAGLSRMTIVLRGRDDVIEQARRQLEDLVPVWAVLDYTNTMIVERELLLVKVSILGPEHLHEQLKAIKFEEYDNEFMLEADLGTESHNSDSIFMESQTQLTPSSVLRQKFSHLRALTELAKLFGARVVDVANDSIIIELTAKSTRLDAFIKLIKPFGILEAARSGTMALPRTPLHGHEDKDAEESEESLVDASMLPPG